VAAFDCNGCGGCCRRVRNIHPDWPTRPDGACIHLTADNRCAIYEKRPMVCRVDAMRPPEMSVERWHQLNAEMCARFQAEDAP
jgi:uncharacterized protein